MRSELGLGRMLVLAAALVALGGPARAAGGATGAERPAAAPAAPPSVGRVPAADHEPPTPPGGKEPELDDGVQQRIDPENPKRRRAVPQDANALPLGPDGRRRPTAVEAVSTSPASGPPRMQIEPAPSRTTVTPNQIEQLVVRSREGVDFFELVDDMIDEVARQIAREDPNLFSPMAIRLVRLSANLRPEFARTLEARLVARVLNATSVKITVCAECNAMRSRVENGSWMVTLGAVRQEDLRRLGDTVGVKTFMDIDFTYSADANVIWMEAMAFRASDGGVVWSDAYRSDGTMAALVRTGQRIPTRAERAAELEQKLSGRPNYGYAASLGIGQIGYSAPTGDIIGATASLRFHERFGENQTSLFGISAGVFTTGKYDTSKQPMALNSILLGAYYSYDLSPPNLNKPEMWVYGEAGGMFTGNEGNTFYFEGGFDLHLKFRLSLEGGLMYLLPTTFSGHDLGGVGFRLRVAMNW
jgi:hypothetical protein